MELKITPSGQTIVKPTALGPGANTDTKLLIYGLFQKGRVLAQDGEATQCGKLRLKTIDGDVPIPFSPVMAGVLIAGEIIKEQVLPEFALDSYYFNTLLGRFMTRVVPYRRRPRASCQFCSDPDFQAQYDSRRLRTARSASH